MDPVCGSNIWIDELEDADWSMDGDLFVVIIHTLDIMDEEFLQCIASGDMK